MRSSDSVTKISAAIVKAQAAIEPAPKDAANPFFKSRYSDLPTVWRTVKDALHANGLAVVQGGEAEPNRDGIVAISTRLIHESGEWIESTLVLPVVKADPQALGSATTYARRYALSAMLGVVSETDDDGESAMDRNTKPPKASDADDGLGGLI